VAFLKAAIKLWADRMDVSVKGQATPENIAAITATVYRLEAITRAIAAPRVSSTAGNGTWLSRKEVTELFSSVTKSTLRERRDKILLALALGAGLRRSEAVSVRFTDIDLRPVNGKFRAVLNVTGKGSKHRQIPLSDEIAAALDEWKTEIGDGFILRGFNRDKTLSDTLSAVGFFKIVQRLGKSIGHPELAPHDLRRTWAQLGFEAGVPITQISKLLGHASVATTQRYLNLDLDLSSTISDFIPFK